MKVVFHFSFSLGLLFVAFTSPAGNLISNGDFEAGNAGFSSDATFVPEPDSIEEGEYSVRSDASSVNASWSGVDHTSGTGLFLMCNGFGGGNETVAWRDAVNVLEGSTYFFGAWVNNLVDPLAGNRPNPRIELRADGLPVTSKDISETPDVWIRLSGKFVAASNLVVLEIVSTAPSLDGNDFGLDDIVLIDAMLVFADGFESGDTTSWSNSQ